MRNNNNNNRPFANRKDDQPRKFSSNKPSFNDENSDSRKRNYNDKPERNYRDSGKRSSYKKDYSNSDNEKPYKKSNKFEFDMDFSEMKKENSDNRYSGRNKNQRNNSSDNTRYESSERRPYKGRPSRGEEGENSSRNRKYDERPRPRRTTDRDKDKPFQREHTIHKDYKSKKDEVRLNKYIANSGICSRRDADLMISTGNVTVNGKIVTTLGYKVQRNDIVSVDGKQIRPEKPVYLLLNKPKDYLTTTTDPMKRKTVMELVKDACKERIFPVGRLDRNTTGILLFTNDGDMAKKLMHPKHKIIKVYQATLDRNLEKADMASILAGVEIDEEIINVDAVAWKDYDSKNQAEIQLHSGQYHIVKRIFEKFNYNVIRLDRIKYGPLTKKNLPRGRWRFLTEDEINILHRI